jgi:hypothetical protein
MDLPVQGGKVMKRFVLGFVILALGVASAETYRFTLFQPSVVQGTELKAGDYKLDLQDSKVVIKSGRQSVEATVKVENSETKFTATTVRYTVENGKHSIQEIRLGGSKTKLVFNP